MAHTKTVLKFVVPATVAVAVGLILSGAVRHFAPIDHARENHTVGPELSEIPNPGLSRVRLLVSNLN
jgi:hypothetical protein